MRFGQELPRHYATHGVEIQSREVTDFSNLRLARLDSAQLLTAIPDAHLLEVTAMPDAHLPEVTAIPGAHFMEVKY